MVSRGEETPLLGRIVAIADSFDFLTSSRPYHRAVSPKKALSSMLAERGCHFDPALLDCFCATVR
jgi:HD-GYP domain-containing protein (c-di-GMP phosphodiesterase class II)